MAGTSTEWALTNLKVHWKNKSRMPYQASLPEFFRFPCLENFMPFLKLSGRIFLLDERVMFKAFNSFFKPF